MILIVLSIILAFALWFFMFYPPLQARIDFWLVLSCSAVALASLGLIGARRNIRQNFHWEKKFIFVGIVSAIVLYVIFFIGSLIIHGFIPRSVSNIGQVYVTRADAPGILIGLLLFFIIAPAEEIFWRGFVQQRCIARWGQVTGYFCAVGAYTLVHVSSCNTVLLIAALVCGLFWGWLFLRFKSVWPGIISHAVWDILVFVILPFK